MPNFTYKLRDKTGRAVSGTMASQSPEALAKYFHDMGYTPISISEKRPSILDNLKIADLFKKITMREVNIFTRQLATFVGAGIPILGALKALVEQTEDKNLREIVIQIKNNVEAGTELSDSLERYPRVFSRLYVEMIRAGEASGKLVDILSRLADLNEREEIIRQEIKSATRYPIIVVIAISAVFTGITTFVLPKFAKLFARFGASLPLPTKIMLTINNFIQQYGIFIFIGLILGAIGFFYSINTRTGRNIWDKTKLKAPIVGKLCQNITMSRFSRISGTLLESGLPLLQVLDLVANIVGNTLVARSVIAVRNHAKEGRGMAGPMKLDKTFPPMIVHMVATGEESGTLGTLLLRASEHYDREVNTQIKNLTSLIEPALIVFLGIAVLALALAIFLPMWNMMRLFQ